MRARHLLVAVVCPIALSCAESDPNAGLLPPGSAGQAPFTGGTSAGLGGGASAGTTSAGTVNGGSASGSGGAGMSGGGTSSAGAAGAATNAGSGGSGGSNAGSAGTAGSGGSADPAERPGWKLTWRDEFDGPAGSKPDSLKWTPRVGQATANKELEYYSDRPENLQLDGNGFLVITARKESYMGSQYTSARIESGGKFEQAYGRFESRIKIPRGQGIWPAFWIMGNNAEVGWPQRGELDIMENRGKEPTINVGAMHGPGYSGAQDFRAEYVIAEGIWMNFHVFALEWEPNVVRWYVDDNLYETRTPQDLADRGGDLEWVYDHPFFIIFNVAVGGAFPGNPDNTTPFPQQLQADYVRVWARP
jgi:beta-glucanase (GH16 family)